LDTGADGGGPQGAVPSELQSKRAPRCKEAVNFFVRSSGKEKDVVKIALAGKLGLLLRQARVLDEFARREGAKRHNWYSGILGERLQGISGGREGLRDRKAGKAAQAHSGGPLRWGGVGCRAQVEIVLGQKDGAAVFRDEGVRVGVLAAGLIELETRAAGEPNGRKGLVIEGGSEFVKARVAFSFEGNQFINGDV
jgi:hypothetical protein